MKKEFYLYVNGQKVKVSEEIYKVYWREREHEKYLEQVDRKNHLLFFSSLDQDGHFAENIIDESVDVEKIVETQMMIEAVRNAISRLENNEKGRQVRKYFIECERRLHEAPNALARKDAEKLRMERERLDLILVDIDFFSRLIFRLIFSCTNPYTHYIVLAIGIGMNV